MVTIGCDPEFFLKNKEGEPISAIGIIEGSKKEPIKTEVGAYHVDNVAAEINAIPASHEDEFVANINNIVHVVEDIAARNGLVISKSMVEEFSMMQLLHPDAQAAGCERDFNCYSDDPMIPNQSKSYEGTNLRAVGGHIHVGFNGEDIDPVKLVKALDLFVTIPMLKAEDPRRRELYGQAGDFRWKPYGIEYRTPSNVWTYTAERMRWAFRQTMKAIEHHRNDFPDVRDVINNHDIAKAEELLKQYNLEVIPDGV